METWEGAEDERYQKLLTELKAHPKLVVTEVVDALGPRLTGIEQTTGEILRIVQQTSQTGGTDVQPSAGKSQLPPQIAPNPFGDVGRLTDPARFWDREELLRRIFEELNKGVNLSLVGDAQVGKSSLLSMTYHYGPQRIHRPVDGFVYLSLEEVDDEDEFYAALCERLGTETCRGYKLTRALQGRRYVLCIDEVEKLGWEQFGFTRKVRSHLRGLADGSDAPFTLVVASRSPLAHLFPNSSGTRLALWPASATRSTSDPSPPTKRAASWPTPVQHRGRIHADPDRRPARRNPRPPRPPSTRRRRPLPQAIPVRVVRPTRDAS